MTNDILLEAATPYAVANTNNWLPMPPKQLEHTLNFDFWLGTRLFVVKLFQYCSEDFSVGTGFVGNSVVDKSVVGIVVFGVVVFTDVCTATVVVDVVAADVFVVGIEVVVVVVGDVVIIVDVNADDVDTAVRSTLWFVWLVATDEIIVGDVGTVTTIDDLAPKPGIVDADGMIVRDVTLGCVSLKFGSLNTNCGSVWRYEHRKLENEHSGDVLFSKGKNLRWYVVIP